MNIYLVTNYEPINAVKKALLSLNNNRRLKLTIYQTDYLNTKDRIIPQIIESIKKANIVIADISSDNPNIYYEIGIAHSLGKPVIFVSQKDNFSRISLLSNRFYKYEPDTEGIKNLAFSLYQILINHSELEELNPLDDNYNNIKFQKDIFRNNRLKDILKLNGINRGYEFENWIFDLLNKIPSIEVERSVRNKRGEYDFIIWNSTNDRELEGLGNPIPIEAKSTKIIENNLILQLANKASLQGFRSFILITTAEIAPRNENLINRLKSETGVSILIIDIDDLKIIQNPKDLYAAIKKSFRKYFIS